MARAILVLAVLLATLAFSAGAEQEAGCVPDDGSRDLSLVHVVVVHRHGDRTPISTQAASYTQGSEQKEFWEGTVPAIDTVEEWGALNVDDTGTFKLRDPKFPNGHLTHVGASGMRAVGEALRQSYVPHFLPATLPADSTNVLRVRSTRYPRTFQSVQNLLSALYPHAHRDLVGGSGGRIAISSMNKTNDFMTGPSEERCPRLKAMNWKSGKGEDLPGGIQRIADLAQVPPNPEP
jgi:hypothetical protein